MAEASWRSVMGPAQGRTERRLRSWYRHEQQTVRIALATFTHHSAPRGQKTARAGKEGNEVHSPAAIRAKPPSQTAGTEYFAFDVEDVPAAVSRPDRLSALFGPQERVQRHTVEQMGDCVPSRCSMFLCLRWLTGWWSSCRALTSSSLSSKGLKDHSRGWDPTAFRSSRAAAGGTAGGSARARVGRYGTRQCAPLASCGATSRRGVGGAARGWVALDTSSGASRKASPPAQGGVQILGTVVRRAAVSPIQEQILAVVGLVGLRPCAHAAQAPTVFAARELDGASDSVHRLLLRHRDRYAQCKLCRFPRFRQRSSWLVVAAPVLCDDRCSVVRTVLETVKVPQLQFLRCGRRYAAKSSQQSRE